MTSGVLHAFDRQLYVVGEQERSSVYITLDGPTYKHLLDVPLVSIITIWVYFVAISDDVSHSVSRRIANIVNFRCNPYSTGCIHVINIITRNVRDGVVLAFQMYAISYWIYNI